MREGSPRETRVSRGGEIARPDGATDWNGFDIDEMYDLQEDPHEMRNLIGEESLASARGEPRGKLYELMNRCGDPYGDVGPGRSHSDRANRYGAPRYLPRS